MHLKFLFLHQYNNDINMDKKDLDIAYFISFCIEQYKTKWLDFVMENR